MQNRKGVKRYSKYQRKRVSRYSKKSKYNKRFSKPSVKILKRNTIIPDRYFTKLKFSETVDIRPTVAAPNARQVWRGNSLFDPDQSSTGGQPTGFDQLMSLYTNYRVYASSIKLQIMPLQTTSASFTKWCLYPCNTPSNDLSPDVGAERPYSKNTFVGGSGQNMRFMKNFMSTKRLLGYNNILDNDNFIGTSGTNPSTQWYWVADYQTVGGLNNLDPGYMNCTITYYVEFFNRIDLTGS